MKPSSGSAKHIKDKLECLNKDYIENGGKEMTFKANKAKEKGEKGKQKAEEPQRENSHSNSSALVRFGTTRVYAAKQIVFPL